MLDKIRGSAVTLSEPGQITQSIGATNIPAKTIKKICGELLEKFKIELIVPGLLVIDSPGHASFVTLRRRGGAIADLAILVIDINEGFKEQTEESLNILKEYKTPFIVAATKIDKIQGWHKTEDLSFLKSLINQREDVKDTLNNKIYNLIMQLSERGFDSERFDRVEDFTKQVAVIPVSSYTKEGLSELLLMLAGISQKFLKDRLELSNKTKGTILEVKEVKGLGTTIDVILYDGSISKGNFLIIGGKTPIVTKIKALLTPRPLQELRVEKQFESVNTVNASAGIKISAPNLENVIAGSPVMAVKNENEVENALEEIRKDVEEVEFKKELEGVSIKADTLGSLEAMIKLLTDEKIPIRKADVGQITKEDLVNAQTVGNELNKIILVFNLKTPEETKLLAKDLGVMIFENQVIYRLIESYKEWCSQKTEREIQAKLETVTRPCELLFLKNSVFRQSHPAVFGVEIIRGFLNPGTLLKKDDGKIIGRIKEMQKEGKTISEAKKGDKVAISIEGVTVDRHIFEGDKLFSALSEAELKVLREVYSKLTES